MLGFLVLSVGLLLQVVGLALDSSLVRLLFSLELSEHLDPDLDVSDSSDRFLGSLNVSLGDSNSQADDLRLALLARMQLDSSQLNISLEAESGGTLGLLLGLSQGLDLESEVGSVLLVDVDFSLQAVGSLLLCLSQLDLESVSTQVMLLGGADLKSQLLDSGNSNDSLEVDNLSVAFPSHGLRFGLLVLSLPFADVALLSLNLRLVEVSVQGLGGLLCLLGVLSGAFLVVLDGPLANSLLGFELDQFDLEMQFLLSRG